MDLPAAIDDILEVTKQPKAHLVAHSKGASAALELLAGKTDYNEKVRILLLLTPVTYMEAEATSASLLKIALYIVSLGYQIIRFVSDDSIVLLFLGGSHSLRRGSPAIFPVCFCQVIL